MELPEHVTLCDICGCAPAHDMTIPKWVFREVGQCFADGDCAATEDASTDGDQPGWKDGRLIRKCPRCQGTDFDSATDLMEHVRTCADNGLVLHRELYEYLIEKGEREDEQDASESL